MIDYSTPDLIDWSKTKCTSVHHVWDFGDIDEADIDPNTRCDCGRFEYRQFDWNTKDLMGSGDVSGV